MIHLNVMLAVAGGIVGLVGTLQNSVKLVGSATVLLALAMLLGRFITA